MSSETSNDETNLSVFRTPDSKLHTGSENPIDPEDLVRASGREPTPERLARAAKLLEEEGPSAVERYLP
ncbi:hypothetical protein GCM10010406_38030 [Streptomyces thermolineatus]|uniref:Uncharacterized protein n=1 Tax=Streptomyces thermolineatus TaxID=44033 RepID=A0ABP5ZIH2_9ACTN|nr:hypothetical protein [Streptomyces sp. SCUT-3]QMV23668.1 hypothetical protein GQS52_19955 [Streptomyces sp. SCUT-3]